MNESFQFNSTQVCEFIMVTNRLDVFVMTQARDLPNSDISHILTMRPDQSLGFAF